MRNLSPSFLLARASLLALLVGGLFQIGSAQSFTSREAAQMTSTSTASGWSVDPLLTVGETNADGDDVNLDELGYRLPGILDGTGAYKLNGSKMRVLVNHEFSSSRGYPYSLANGTQLTGARVSYVDIGRHNRRVSAMGLAYDVVYDRYGNMVTSATQINEGTDPLQGFNRFCSAYFVGAGETGFEDNVFLTGEETGGGQECALDADNGKIYVAPMMGRAAFENVCPVENFKTDKVVIIIGDDRGGAPLLLYVGEKGSAPSGSYSPPEFLKRNGLGNGNLYVWVADNGDRDPSQWNGTGTSRTGKFVKIPFYDPSMAGTAGYDAVGFIDQSGQDLLADVAGFFAFSRPEDVANNPYDKTQIVMASTGRSSLFPDDSWGTTYLIDFDNMGLQQQLVKDLADIDSIEADLTILYDGDDAGNGQFAGPDYGLRSPDNLDWAKNGYIYLQEDRSVSGFGQTSGEEASVWELDPNTGLMTRMLQMDRSAVPAGQTDPSPTDIGNWESSGIIDVTDLMVTNDPNESILIFDVQAHSLRDGTIGGNSDLVQGGQLVLASKIVTPIASAPDYNGRPESMIGGSSNTSGGWETDVLFTVGETEPSGRDYNFMEYGYRIPGILDGTGAWQWDGNTMRVLVNHEFSSSRGYVYSLANGTELTGARVSYVDVGRFNRKVQGMGAAYGVAYDRYGAVITSATQINEGTDPLRGFDRFCSAYPVEAGYNGFMDNIFFTGEETGGGQECALDVDNEAIYVAPMLGRAAFESVTSLTNFGTDKVVVAIGDDRGGAPLLLYIGEKGSAPSGTYTPGDFLKRNGLGNGNLYVWVADNGDRDPSDWNGTGTSRTGKFVKIPFYDPAQAGASGYDAVGFADQATQDALAEAASFFKFSRPEDVATNPTDGTQFVMASTGRSSLFPADSWGTTYIIDLDDSDLQTKLGQSLSSIDNIIANIDVIYDGDDAGAGQFLGPDYGLRSPDNLEWADDGYIYLQEDRSVGGFGLTSGIEASVFKLNPANGILTRILEMDRSAVPFGQTDPSPTDIGNWESSGILDVSDIMVKKAPNETVMILDVQAHSLRDGSIGGNSDLVQGGQLILLSSYNATPPSRFSVEEQPIIGLFPNPTRSNLVLEIPEAEAGNAIIRIYSTNGRVMMEERAEVSFGTWQHKLSVDRLPAGFYTVEVLWNHKRAVKKFVKE